MFATLTCRLAPLGHCQRLSAQTIGYWQIRQRRRALWGLLLHRSTAAAARPPPGHHAASCIRIPLCTDIPAA